MKLYIASLLAIRMIENGGKVSHTVTSCEAESEDRAKQKFLDKCQGMYDERLGYTMHDVVLLEFGYNSLEGMKV